MEEFKEKSYLSHVNNIRDFTSGGKHEEFTKAWLNKDTVDSWRHIRMYKLLDPLLRGDVNAKWVTIGDGRFGSDAHYIKEKGIGVLATDITDILLKEAKQKGYIDSYRCENAEKLSFSDEEFDFVLCKESYHHFPRPMLALYEMLRVAKKGVVLIEPYDPDIADEFLQLFIRSMRSFIKGMIGRKIVSSHFFEEVNYVYTISKREIEKVALGINLRYVAFKTYNDFYLEGVEFEKADEKSKLFKRIKRRISFYNFLSLTGVISYCGLAAIIFKSEPDLKTKQLLLETGYQVIELPGNPALLKK